MEKVLLGGKGQQKRLYAVDETIYGTEEGAKLQLEAQKNAKKKKKRKKKKKSIDADSDSSNAEDGMVGVKQSVAAVAVVGVLAAGASIFLGGKRS